MCIFVEIPTKPSAIQREERGEIWTSGLNFNCTSLNVAGFIALVLLLGNTCFTELHAIDTYNLRKLMYQKHII